MSTWHKNVKDKVGALVMGRPTDQVIVLFGVEFWLDMIGRASEPVGNLLNHQIALPANIRVFEQVNR